MAPTAQALMRAYRLSYYDQSLPPPAPPVVHSTGATAGIPGTWTPSGSTPPATVADLQGGVPNAVTATPGTGWTSGQFVQTGTAGAPGRATWTGSGWVGGAAPLSAPQAEAEHPSGYGDDRSSQVPPATTGGTGQRPRGSVSKRSNPMRK